MVALGAALAMAAPVAAQEPYDVTAWVNGHGRGLDQARHPDYQQRMIPGYEAGATSAPGWERTFGLDPYLAEDGPRRADWLEVSFPNRYGATMRGTMIAPREGGDHPAIVIEPGGYGPRWGYLNLAQGLAESGYVTLTIAPQGDAEADLKPPDEAHYCNPGDWQKGEGGVTEDGPCAGQERAMEEVPTEDLVVGLATGDPARLKIDDAYRAVRARKAFGVLDATRYLVSGANPWRDRVDAERIGAAGHSFGGHGALVAGQIDTRRLIDAVVAWDGFGPLDRIEPRVPTMFQNSEARLVGPETSKRPRDWHPQTRIAATFREADVDSMVVTLAEGNHAEWSYIPYLGATAGSLALAGDPFAAEGAAASSLGERVGLHYTLAWFDRYLRPGKRSRSAAERRLLTRTFGKSVDEVAIGQGTWDPVTQANVPYAIAGRSVRSHLSPKFTSRADFGRVRCPDLRAGCSP